MSRTPEQVAADDALTAAIQAVAYAYDAKPNVLAEYMVIAEYVNYDENGDVITGVSMMFREGDIPTHRALGLVSYAATRLTCLVNEPDDEA